MANTQLAQSLGEAVRKARIDKDWSLRGLAGRLDKTPSYLSDIENDRRVPSEEVLRDLAHLLSLDFDYLMALAGRLGDDAERLLKRAPLVGTLFRAIADSNLSEDQLRQLLKSAERMAGSRSASKA